MGTLSGQCRRRGATLVRSPFLENFQKICNSVTDTNVEFDCIIAAVAPLDPEDLAALLERRLTKTSLAQRLGVSLAYLNKHTPKLPPGLVRAKRLQTQMLFNTRKGYRLHLAKQVLQGLKSLDNAAKEAKCSVRTLYRYVLKCK